MQCENSPSKRIQLSVSNSRLNLTLAIAAKKQLQPSLTVPVLFELPGAKVFQVPNSEHQHLHHGPVKSSQLLDFHVQKQCVMVFLQLHQQHGIAFRHF